MIIIVGPKKEIKEVLKEKFGKLLGMDVENVKLFVYVVADTIIDVNYVEIKIFPFSLLRREEDFPLEKDEVRKIVKSIKDDIFEMFSKMNFTSKNITKRRRGSILIRIDGDISIGNTGKIIGNLGDLINISDNLEDDFESLENYALLKVTERKISDKLKEFNLIIENNLE